MTTPEAEVARGGFLNWLFRSRQTGRIVLAQPPNPPLVVWLVALVVNRLVHPQGWLHTALVVVAAVASLVWAADELIRGVNPFRRLLGAAVLIWFAASLA